MTTSSDTSTSRQKASDDLSRSQKTYTDVSKALEAVTRVLIARVWFIGGFLALVGLLITREPRFAGSVLLGTAVACINLLLMSRNARRAAACPQSAAASLRKAFAGSLVMRYGAFLLVLAAIGSVVKLDVIGLAVGLFSAQASALSLKVRQWKKSANIH